MTKRKSISASLLLILLIMFTLIFSACGTLTSTIISYEDGSIEENFTITIDPIAVVNAGYNLSSFKDDVMVKGNYFCDYFKTKYRENLIEDINLNDKYVLKYFNYLNNAVKYTPSSWQNNTISFSINFSNIYAYKYYYGVKTEENNAEYEIEKHFLYTKLTQKGSTLFARYSDLYNMCKDYFENTYPNLFTEEMTKDSNILYVYQTDLRREHSNADEIIKSGGMYYHTWIVDKEDINTDMEFYYIIANSGNWIMICICTTLIAISVMLIIAVIIKNKNNNKKLNLLQKIIQKYKNNE